MNARSNHALNNSSPFPASESATAQETTDQPVEQPRLPKSYAVTLVCPPGYVHSLALLEIAETLHHALTNIGVDSILTDQFDEPGRCHIVLGAHLLSKFAIGPLKPGSIIYNFEQVDPASPWLEESYLSLLRTHEVWDYSARNIPLLQRQGVANIQHVPLGYVAQMERIKPAEQDIDVLFYGSINPRRQAVLDALKAASLNVKQVFNCYGPPRDELIARSKIVLNMHYYESKIFEVARVSYLLSNGVCVVSETGNDPIEQDYAGALAFSSYEALVETCVDLIADTERRQTISRRGQEFMRTLPQEPALRQLLRRSTEVPKPTETLEQATPTAVSQPPASHSTQSSQYYQGINNWLLNAVPSTAKVILEIGCAEGRLGAALKQIDPARIVYGVEKIPEVANEARSRLDRVFVLDVENELPDIAPNSVDCILYGDVLEHLATPLEVLRSHQHFLKPGGEILCCVPNVQHFSILRNLLSSDFQYESAGLMDATHLRFFTYSTFTKLLLDAGYAPELVTSIAVEDRSDLMPAATPLITALGLDLDRTTAYLAAYQYIFRGSPLHWEQCAPETPISFVVCVNNEEQLNANLLRSDCFKQPSIHELILVRNARSAAEGLNLGLDQAVNAIVVLLHQDVYLPPGWPRQFIEQYRLAEEKFGNIGMAGLFGVLNNNGQKQSFGHVVDRHRTLSCKPLPALVETVDELAMAVPKSSRVRFDPSLGWHLYGADFALQTMQQGKSVTVLDALCFHHSRGGFTVPEQYHQSASVFRQKWTSHLPIYTPCADFN